MLGEQLILYSPIETTHSSTGHAATYYSNVRHLSEAACQIHAVVLFSVYVWLETFPYYILVLGLCHHSQNILGSCIYSS